MWQYSQDIGILKSYLARIQELELKLQHTQRTQISDLNRSNNQELCMNPHDSFLMSAQCIDLGSETSETLKGRSLPSSGKTRISNDVLMSKPIMAACLKIIHKRSKKEICSELEEVEAPSCKSGTKV